MKIDEVELQKQRKEEMLKGEHIRLEIVLDNGGSIPYIQTEIAGANMQTMMGLLISIDSVKEDLIKKYPMLAMYKIFFGSTNMKSIEIEHTREEE